MATFVFCWLHCTEIKRKVVMTFGGGRALPLTTSVFQYFCLFLLDSKVYSAIFQTLTCFQETDWKSCERALRVACELSLTQFQPDA